MIFEINTGKYYINKHLCVVCPIFNLNNYTSDGMTRNSYDKCSDSLLLMLTKSNNVHKAILKRRKYSKFEDIINDEKASTETKLSCIGRAISLCLLRLLKIVDSLYSLYNKRDDISISQELHAQKHIIMSSLRVINFTTTKGIAKGYVVHDFVKDIKFEPILTSFVDITTEYNKIKVKRVKLYCKIYCDRINLYRGVYQALMFKTLKRK